MQTELTDFFHRSQDQYLRPEEIKEFRGIISALKERLAAYECLRDQELIIFQTLAEQLEEVFPEEHPKVIERALKHWISALRYAGMAMLLNNPEYLQHRLLEWLTDMIAVHQMQSLESYLYEFLQAVLSEILPPEQLALLHPFLEQAKTTLLVESASSEGEMDEFKAMI